MESAWYIDRLAAFAGVPKLLLGGLDAKSARWRPDSEDWSIIEIVSHLVDEEVEDFRMRLRLTLEAPDAQWPVIDPEAAANQRQYQERELQDMLWQFQSARMETVAWLRSMPVIDLSIAHHHPKFEPMTAGSLLASWCAHDALHLRQLARRLHGLTAVHAGSHDTGYAGEWPES